MREVQESRIGSNDQGRVQPPIENGDDGRISGIEEHEQHIRDVRAEALERSLVEVRTLSETFARHRARMEGLDPRQLEQFRKDHLDANAAISSSPLPEDLRETAGMEDVWTIVPPYDSGYPMPEVSIETDPGILNTEEALANPSEGWVSLGAAVGECLGLQYPPANQNGNTQARSAEGGLRHFHRLPRPLTESAVCTVIAAIRIQPSPATSGPRFLLHGGDGHAAVWGRAHLTVTSDRAATSPTTESTVFANTVRYQESGTAVHALRSQFEITSSALLRPGATTVRIFFDVETVATLFGQSAATPAVPPFAGIDCRDRRTEALWWFKPGGGPIQVDHLTLRLKRIRL